MSGQNPHHTKPYKDDFKRVKKQVQFFSGVKVMETFLVVDTNYLKLKVIHFSTLMSSLSSTQKVTTSVRHKTGHNLKTVCSVSVL